MLAALVLLPLPGPARAQEDGQVLTVSPLLLKLEAESGDELQRTVQVTADGDEPLTVEFQHADFGFGDETYEVQLIEDDAERTTGFSTRGWFSVPKERYRIPAGKTIDVPVTIDVPENTPGGTYLGAAFFRTVPSADGQSSQVVTAARTGPLVFISVAGGDPPDPRLDELDVPRVATEGPIEVDATLVNDGDAFFTYDGTVTLDGDEESAVQIPSRVVVPGEPRELLDVDGEQVAVGGEGLGIGRHEVTVRLRTEPGALVVEDSRTVWIIPPWLWSLIGLAVIGAVISIGWIAWWLVERRREQALGLDEDELDLDVADDDLEHDPEPDPLD